MEQNGESRKRVIHVTIDFNKDFKAIQLGKKPNKWALETYSNHLQKYEPQALTHHLQKLTQDGLWSQI